MKKRIYLSIIYFITLICIIIGVLGNVFNISPFTRMTMASSGKYIENSSIYDNVSDISIDMNLGSVEIKKGSKLEVIYTGAEKFKPAVSVSGTSLNIEQHVKVHLMTNIKNSDCTLTITVPDNVSLNSIQADLNMGDMDVNNIHASSADFSVDMGSLKIADSSIKNITADNNMGDIKLTNCDSDALNLSVDMGSLKISGMDIDKYSANLSVDLGDIKVNDSTYSVLPITSLILLSLHLFLLMMTLVLHSVLSAHPSEPSKPPSHLSSCQPSTLPYSCPIFSTPLKTY